MNKEKYKERCVWKTESEIANVGMRQKSGGMGRMSRQTEREWCHSCLILFLLCHADLWHHVTFTYSSPLASSLQIPTVVSVF